MYVYNNQCHSYWIQRFKETNTESQISSSPFLVSPHRLANKFGHFPGGSQHDPPLFRIWNLVSSSTMVSESLYVYIMPCSYQTCKRPEITTNMHRKPPRLSGSQTHHHPWVLQTPIQWVPLSHDLNVLYMSILDTSVGDLGGSGNRKSFFRDDRL